MSWTGCEDFLWWFCERQATDPAFRARLRSEMDESGDPLRGIVRAIGEMEPGMASLAETELGELPPVAIRTMLDAWREADDASLQFEAHSVRPDSLMEFARKRRVRVIVDREAERISVGLSHVPGRHPKREDAG